MRLYFQCALVFGLLTAGACNRTFYGHLVDESGRPVENAILYIEAFTTHTYAFGWAQTNQDGIAANALVFPAKTGTRYAFCILTPNRLPVVIFDYTGFFSNDTFSFVLDEKANNPLGFNQDLFKLGLPFELDQQLLAQLKLPQNRPLVDAFIAAYAMGMQKGAAPDPLKKKTLEEIIYPGSPQSRGLSRFN
jgi:hypothetical protein